MPSQKTTAWIGFGYRYKGTYRSCKNGRDVLQKAFQQLALDNPRFLADFAARTDSTLFTKGQVRRYLARTKLELYPNHPDLALLPSHAVKLYVAGEWWLDVHQDMRMKERILQMACEVAGLRYGEDLKVDLG